MEVGIEVPACQQATLRRISPSFTVLSSHAQPPDPFSAYLWTQPFPGLLTRGIYGLYPRLKEGQFLISQELFILSLP